MYLAIVLQSLTTEQLGCEKNYSFHAILKPGKSDFLSPLKEVAFFIFFKWQYTPTKKRLLFI